MRIVVATAGSTGHLHPLLAIALALQRRNHRVSFVTQERYRQRVEASGLKFFRLRPDLDAMDPAFATLFAERTEFDARIGEAYAAAMSDMFDDLLANSADAELIVSLAKMFPVQLVAHVRRAPWVSCMVYPSASLVAGADGQLMRGSVSGAESAQTTKAAARTLATLCRARGIPASAIFAKPDLALALFSPRLVDDATQWQGVHVVGFTRHDVAGSALSQPLLTFLGSGSAPVVFTLGSAGIFPDRAFHEMAVSAVARLGCRAILMTRPEKGGEPQDIPSDGSLFVERSYVDYAALFARAGAVVHHGGIGTIAYGLRAGVPMLVIPSVTDQPINAAVVRQLGVARVLPFRDLSVDTLVDELRALLGDPSYRRKAMELAGAIQEENGAEAACRLIEAGVAQARSATALASGLSDGSAPAGG
jgi:MGT family glycosyltransferase